MLRPALVLSALWLAPFVLAQTPAPAPPQLSPRAAYDDAMRPLDTTRDAIGNWSESELSALAVTMSHARIACAARDPKTYTGDNLIDLARLCALGQSWPAVVDATTLYIKTDNPTKPLLIQAYAARLDAELYLKDEPDALADGLTLLKTLPFDGLADKVITEALDYMQFNFTPDALTLAAAREPVLLIQLQKSTPQITTPSSINAPSLSTNPSTNVSTFTQAPGPSVHELHADALAYAALLQLTNQTPAAAETVTALDAALPKNLPPDESLPIDASRQRYALLGQPLPPITELAFLALPNKIPEIPAKHAITAFLLFPDWCAQCLRMTTQLPPTVFHVEKSEAYAYALLAETPAPDAPMPIAPTAPAKPTPRQALAETPTIIVPPSTLTQLRAPGIPTLIIVNSQGIVRILQTVGEDAVRPGSIIDSAIARVGAYWPLPATDHP